VNQKVKKQENSVSPKTPNESLSKNARKRVRKQEREKKAAAAAKKLAIDSGPPKEKKVNKDFLDKRFSVKEKSYKTCERCTGLFYGPTTNFKKYEDYKLVFEKNNVCICSKCLAILMKETGVLCDINKIQQ
jgi:hypothetical protein